MSFNNYAQAQRFSEIGLPVTAFQWELYPPDLKSVMHKDSMHLPCPGMLVVGPAFTLDDLLNIVKHAGLEISIRYTFWGCIVENRMNNVVHCGQAKTLPEALAEMLLTMHSWDVIDLLVTSTLKDIPVDSGKLNNTIMNKPTIGRIVHYLTTEQDRQQISYPKSPGNAQTLLPAVIVHVYGDSCVNLKVLGDGEKDLWKTSVPLGTGEGNWQWPAVTKPEEHTIVIPAPSVADGATATATASM